MTRGVQANISIPANQRPGNFSGRVTFSGTGIPKTTIALNLVAWKGNLPAFAAGSVDSRYADMLKSWLPFYRSNFDGGEAMTCGGPGCTTEQAPIDTSADCLQTFPAKLTPLPT